MGSIEFLVDRGGRLKQNMKQEQSRSEELRRRGRRGKVEKKLWHSARTAPSEGAVSCCTALAQRVSRGTRKEDALPTLARRCEETRLREKN